MAVSEKTTAAFENAVIVYDAMHADASRKKVDGQLVYVWEGFATHLFSKLGIPTPYYGFVTRLLKDLGCVRTLRRGARTTTSLYGLYKKPTKKDFEQYRTNKKKTGSDKASNRAKLGSLEQRVKDLLKALEGLDVKRALHDLAKENSKLSGRVEKLEAHVEKLEGQVKTLKGRGNPK